MSDDADSKQHDPSQKRLNDMKEKGQTLRSKDLSGGVLLFTSIILIMLMSETIKSRIERNFIECYTSLSLGGAELDVLFDIFKNLALKNFFLLIQLVSLLFFSVFLSVFILGGWNFSIKSISFKWTKLDPIANLNNLISKRMLTELSKSLIKFFIIVGTFLYYMYLNSSDLISLSYLTLNTALNYFYEMVKGFIFAMLVGVVVIVGVDAMFSFFAHKKQSKMSTQELKDENKDLEGSPETKGRQRSARIAILKQQINVLVPKSTVVITNPTHYAVALRYRDGIDHAPVVLAKGKGEIALHIRKLASSNGIPIYEAPPLARSIYFTTKMGREIHPGLYMAVAAVLAYLNQLRHYQYGRGPLPVKKTDFDIPAELQF